MVAGCVKQLSSYTVTIVLELAWANSALVVLVKWLSYRGGRLSRFDCNISEGLYEGLFLEEECS